MADGERWADLLRQGASEDARRLVRICELAAQVAGATGAGISIVSDTGVRGVVCATDDVSARIEDLQLTLGEGPCVDAVASGGPVLVPDVDVPDGIGAGRWPAFIDAVAEGGVRAVFALPLRIGAIRLGALDLYRSSAGPMSSDQLSAALSAADAAALALLGLDLEEGPGSGNGAPMSTIHQREVHQATGMVKSQMDVSINDAFLMIRAYAYSSGRPLIDVARDVVNRRLRFPPEEQS